MTSDSKSKPPIAEGRPKASFWHVDREMLRFKIHFFLFIGGLSAAIPFIVVFAKVRLGLAPTSLGAVLTAQMFLYIFTKPMIGYIADYFNKLKSIIVVLTLITGSCYFFLLAIPKFEHEPSDLPDSPLCHRYGELLKLSRELENNLPAGIVETRNESETCQLCSHYTHCALNIPNQSSLKSHELANGSYGQRQQELTFGNERILLVVCNEYDSVITSLCSCSSKNSSGGCIKMVCSNMLTDKVGSDYPRNSSASNLAQGLVETLNRCRHRNSSAISEPGHISDFQTMQFWIFALLFSLSGICANATFTLSDTACCESIQKTGADFGKQRMWGSVGWGLIAPIAGLVNDYTGDFLDSWILMAAMLLLFLWNLTKLDLVKPHFSQNILGDVGTVLKSKEFLAYEVVIFMNGVSTGMIWFYLIWFLTSIGGSEFLCGLCIAVQCFCGAIPFMFFSGWVIRRVGCFQILSAALLTYVVRFLWYSYLHNPWWVLPVECSHGITYGLYYTVLAQYGKKSSKPGTEATTQSVLFSTHEGLGAGLGCVLAGIGFDYFGGRETFFAASLFCACGFVISVVLFITVIRQKRVDEATDTSQPEV